MATLDYTIHVSFPTPTGEVVTFGSRAAPEAITVDGIYKGGTKSLANNLTWDFWIVGADESITSSTGWDFFCMVADQDVLVELVCDTANDVGRVAFAKTVPSGIPWAIPADDARALHTVDFATGQNDVIDAIRIRNISGSTANVTAYLVT